MKEKDELYLKIIRGEELSEHDKASILIEEEGDPRPNLLVGELRKMYLESCETPTEYLDEEKAWNRFKAKAEPKKITKLELTLKKGWKYAAAIIGLLIIGYGVFRNNEHREFKGDDIAVGDQIELQLADGRTVVLDESDNFSITDVDGGQIGYQKDDALHYTESGMKLEKEEFNRLIVPYGKRFRIYLSDGSRVHVNSGTILRYPVTFGKEGIRQIFLEEGEAYFEVVRDEHRPFLVNTDMIDIHVLGTEFNVSSYREDEEVRTVLVRGSVEVEISGKYSSENESSHLSPGEMASYKKSSKMLNVEAVEILNYTGWKDDRMVFIDEQFKEIIKKIERYYRVKVINKYGSLDTARFYGDFDLTRAGLEDILEVIKTSRSFDYSIEGDLITIKEFKE